MLMSAGLMMINYINRSIMLQEIHKKNKKVEEQMHWYGSVLDAIPFMVSVQDIDRKMTFINAAAESFLDTKRTELVGKPCKEHWKLSICGTDDCAITCAQHGRRDTAFKHDGLSYKVNVETLKALESREPVGYIEVIQDVTAIEEVAKSAAEAESRAKSVFLATMSHEIRTPLNAIIGMTEIGRKSQSAEKKEYALSRIKDASSHLLGLINDILDMSKIESGKLELSPVQFAFERLLQKVLTVISFKVEEKNQHLEVNVADDVPHTIYGDDQRLLQIITNLLSNAVKFTPECGTIVLDVKTEVSDVNSNECMLVISVTDNGIGISEDNQHRLFNAFEQAERGISREFGGTGLGLAISKRIVELMDG
jgi:signal transduction histidine kinase